MKICSHVRGLCLRSPVTSHVISATGVALIIGSIWVATQHQGAIHAWVAQNFLLHGFIFGVALVADIVLTSAFICLGFSDCSKDQSTVHQSYHGGRSRVFPENWSGALGKNPRRTS